MSARRVIVNADDFGRSRGINRGVAMAHETGVVTSASLMVRWPAAIEAAALARSMPRLSVGLHVDVWEWVYRGGRWEQVYAVAEEDPEAVTSESRRQLTRFRTLLGRDPSHLDSHQNAHRWEPVRSVLVALADDLGVPLRHCTPEIEHRGDYYGQTAKGEPLAGALTFDALHSIVRSLARGTSELGCHPALAVDFESSYGAERMVELEMLRSPRVREMFEAEDVSLVNFDQALGRVPTPDRGPYTGSTAGR
jgi:chitin disaccharide deacetylase